MVQHVERRGRIQTVWGCIAPEELGPTLMHEHILCDVTPPDIARRRLPDIEISLDNCWEIRHHWGMHHPVDLRLENEDVAAAELLDLKRSGGSAIVELTCSGIAPNASGLRRLSRATGVHIIMGVGFYTEEFESVENRSRSVDWLAESIVQAIDIGVSDELIPSGIIGEIGCSHPWTEFEQRVVRAASIAQRQTGAALNIHSGRHPHAPFAHLELVDQCGGDVTRTVISHVDRTIFDLDTLLRLADTGCYIEFDLFGIESSYYFFDETVDLPNDGIRLNMFLELVRRGYRDQLLMSQDICTKTRLRRFGGHGYDHILTNVVPLMRIKGFSDEDIWALLVGNPRRCLTFN